MKIESLVPHHVWVEIKNEALRQGVHEYIIAAQWLTKFWFAESAKDRPLTRTRPAATTGG